MRSRCVCVSFALALWFTLSIWQGSRFFFVVCHVHWSQYESGNVWIFANRFRYFFGVIFWCANKSNNNNTVLLICFTRTINYFNDASDRTKCNKPPTKQKKEYNTHIHTHLMRNERAICSKKDDLLLCVSHLPIILVMIWIASKCVELANETTKKNPHMIASVINFDRLFDLAKKKCVNLFQRIFVITTEFIFDAAGQSTFEELCKQHSNRFNTFNLVRGDLHLFTSV